MTDILFQENGDLLFVNGDIQYGESTRQHQRDILLAQPGDYKHAPDATVGMKSYLKDDSKDELLSAILVKFRKDGMNVELIDLVGNELKIKASYAS